MKVTVDKDMCIGCGACVGSCPEVFEISDDGYAVAKGVSEETKDAAKEAAGNCPVSAIAVEE